MPTQTRFPKRFTPASLLLALMLISLLSACSASTPSASTTGSTDSYSPQAYPTQANDPSYEEGSGAGQPMPTPAPDYSPGGEVSPLAYTSARMVIKDAQMELLVQDTDQSLARVTQLAADQGGYIISTQTWYSDAYKYATVRMGIPVNTFETTLNTLRQMGMQVLQESASGQDVSTEYRDLQSQLGNLQATAARVREFLAQAQTVEESLRINQALSDLEGQIETIKGQMTFYERRSAFSTVTVTLSPQMPTPSPTPSPTPVPGWNPASTVSDASHALTILGKVVVDMLIWLIVLGGPFVLITLVLVWLARRAFKLWQKI